jgi:hypothetical protein
MVYTTMKTLVLIKEPEEHSLFAKISTMQSTVANTSLNQSLMKFSRHKGTERNSIQTNIIADS